MDEASQQARILREVEARYSKESIHKITRNGESINTESIQKIANHGEITNTESPKLNNHPSPTKSNPPALRTSLKERHTVLLAPIATTLPDGLVLGVWRGISEERTFFDSSPDSQGCRKRCGVWSNTASGSKANRNQRGLSETSKKDRNSSSQGRASESQQEQKSPQ
ncbi:hypothetical protein BJ508DRAFT_350903 [Ascobolus immersus RN42]|uniref:Uncharacterized protein n=1 Tax=Ascobolus immersus RN42 TaxID=1160509 RepID=A0A3N4HT40_ASCIM|nr:hypothetical protein BJ508DRAFT_350903 [Ascobolus immersus RN42]